MTFDRNELKNMQTAYGLIVENHQQPEFKPMSLHGVNFMYRVTERDRWGRGDSHVEVQFEDGRTVVADPWTRNTSLFVRGEETLSQDEFDAVIDLIDKIGDPAAGEK